ncbi:hypothetical protein TNCV_4370691 [Trichonephila clavipes]|uniref:Uncharacterized protein n=1 Tax=Trichonephila clavipes TaxID=2585209 RepID=A0A8X6S6I9_TRICX|nr:hypothetical protein TNCV_4370691 [Trichonephila clavipes]
MVAVDLGHSISGGQIDCQVSCHSARLMVDNDESGDPHMSVHHDHSQTADRVKFMLVPTTTSPATYAYTMSRQITVVLDSIGLESC